jgi:phenylpropionate dioxygenase-like ring-hydroxylating dioxygenase large terminal subunit
MKLKDVLVLVSAMFTIFCNHSHTCAMVTDDKYHESYIHASDANHEEGRGAEENKEAHSTKQHEAGV